MSAHVLRVHGVAPGGGVAVVERDDIHALEREASADVVSPDPAHDLVWAGEDSVRLAQKMQVGPRTPAGVADYSYTRLGLAQLPGRPGILLSHLGVRDGLRTSTY